MKYKITQKVIKIGDSAGVTLPAKALKKAGVKTGDELEISFQKKQLSDAEVIKAATSILNRYHQDFKNLAGR